MSPRISDPPAHSYATYFLGLLLPLTLPKVSQRGFEEQSALQKDFELVTSEPLRDEHIYVYVYNYDYI